MNRDTEAFMESEPKMRVKRFVTTPNQENVYVYYNEDSRTGIVVDPGGSADRILKFIKDNELSIPYILLTHGHFDHIMAVDEVKKATRALVAASDAERELLRNSKLNLAWEVLKTDYGVEVDLPLFEGDVLRLGDISFSVISTPGHTSGGVCFYVEEEGVLFSGDTLFYESVGRVDLPTASPEALDQSLIKLFNMLPDYVRVYPGHSRPTSIEHERLNNPYYVKNTNNIR